MGRAVRGCTRACGQELRGAAADFERGIAGAVVDEGLESIVDFGLKGFQALEFAGRKVFGAVGVASDHHVSDCLPVGRLLAVFASSSQSGNISANYLKLLRLLPRAGPSSVIKVHSLRRRKQSDKVIIINLHAIATNPIISGSNSAVVVHPRSRRTTRTSSMLIRLGLHDALDFEILPERTQDDFETSLHAQDTVDIPIPVFARHFAHPGGALVFAHGAVVRLVIILLNFGRVKLEDHDVLGVERAFSGFGGRLAIEVEEAEVMFCYVGVEITV